MKVTLSIFFIIILHLNLYSYSVEIDETTSNFDILSHSLVFVDENSTLTKEKIVK